MFCPKCNTEIPEKFKFCPECGSDISSASQQSGVEGDVSIGNMKTMVKKPSAESDLSMGDMRTVGRVEGSVDKTGFVSEPLSVRYELHEEIGRGGFAVVYKATDKKLGRTVAIKKLLKDANEVEYQTLERFKREARVIAGLNHRNIVGVYDVGEDRDGIYLVMEYVEGGTLRDLLKEKGALGLPEALALFQNMVKGLAYAHRKNLVHRDIKPANILLQEDNGELIPKIVDFGLAQAGRDSELSMSGYGMGTPWYMPPEQRRDAKNVNHTADIYAVGKTLYEMVSGEIPDNVDPELIPPPKKLATLIFKCIKSKAEDRYFSADELLQAVSGIGVTTKGRKEGSQAGGENGCPVCGMENPADVKFCEGCGGGLFVNCPECDRENNIHKQFCGGCGTDVEGFLNVQEILRRMESYSNEKKWTRVTKEYNLFNQEMRLPGKKGASLRLSVETVHKIAQEKLKQREVIKQQIDTALKQEKKLESVIDLIIAYQKIDPKNTEINALPVKVAEKIDARDFRKVEQLAKNEVAQSKYKDAIEQYQEYLKKYPKGKHVVEARRMINEVLPVQMAEHVYKQVSAKLEKIRRDMAKSSDFEKNIIKSDAALNLCNQFVSDYPRSKNKAVIQTAQKEFSELLEYNRDEDSFATVKNRSRALITAQKYEAVILLYTEYLNQYKNHRDEAERAIKEDFPRAIIDRDAERLRIKRRRQRKSVIVIITIIVLILIGITVDQIVLYQRKEVFSNALQVKNKALALDIAKKLGDRYDTSVGLAELEAFFDVRERYNQVVGEDEESLKKYGGEDWQKASALVVKANAPSIPNISTRRYEEALGLVKGIRDRCDKLIEARTTFMNSLNHEDTTKLSYYAAKEWKLLETKRKQAEERTDPSAATTAYSTAATQLQEAVQRMENRKKAEYNMAMAKRDYEKQFSLINTKLSEKYYSAHLNKVSAMLKTAAEYSTHPDQFELATKQYENAKKTVAQILTGLFQINTAKEAFEYSFKEYSSEANELEKLAPTEWKKCLLEKKKAETETRPKITINSYKKAKASLKAAAEQADEQHRKMLKKQDNYM